MNLARIRLETVALAVSAGVMALVGTYTENSGFQWAGIILGVVVVITGANQANSRDASSEDRKK
jgi:hypothetical protein